MIISRLIEKGCLIQLMASSLFSAHKDFALFLLKNNAYHIFASNAHNVEGYENFAKGLKLLKKNVSEEKFVLMTQTIPSKVVEGSKVKVEKVFLDTGFRSFFRRIFS